MIEGWVCPKCGNVYGPWVQECSRCNSHTEEEQGIQKLAVTSTETGTATEPTPYPMPTLSLDPNRQCVDCPSGVPVKTPDGLETVIKCDLYGCYRSVQDICVLGETNMWAVEEST